MNKEHIRAVIFDFGSVLSMPQDEGFVDEMRRRSGLEGERFVAAYRAPRFDYDRGTLDSAGYWREVMRAGGVPESRIDELDGVFVREMTELDARSWTVIRSPMIEWVRTIKKTGFKTAILSNMPGDHADYIRRNFDWLDLFDVKVFSYALRLVKPEAAIYSECVRRLGIEAGEAIFIDDLATNVEAARSAGLSTILFNDFPGFAESVRAFPGVPLPTLYLEKRRLTRRKRS